MGWFGVFVAIIVGVFVAYVGVALAVALFHPDQRRRQHAAVLVRYLLAFLDIRRSR